MNNHLEEIRVNRRKRAERRPTQGEREFLCVVIGQLRYTLTMHYSKRDGWTESLTTTRGKKLESIRLELAGMWRTDLYLAKDGQIYCPNGEYAWINGAQVFYVELVHLEWLTLDELKKIQVALDLLDDEIAFENLSRSS